jgi:DNA-binding transcriptional MocR family regulator
VDLKKRAIWVRIGLMQPADIVNQLGAWSAGKGPLHQKLANALTEVIRAGGIQTGIRLPSERTLAHALSLSRTTVVTAYDTLRTGGWLESRSGSGTWVSAGSPVVVAARDAAHAGGLAASPLFGLLSNRDASDLLDFALGSPLPLAGLPADFFQLPADEYSACTRDRLYYPLGLPSLRQSLAAYYAAIGLPTHPENILITNGAQQGIALSAALYLQRGDTALVEDPTYFGALDAFRAVGARLSGLPVEAAGVNPAVLRDRISATAARLVYLTPTYQNPTGAVMPRAARKETARIATELGVPIIDDGTLAELVLDNRPIPPVAAFDLEAPIITIGSLSKLIWPGLRIGWVRAPEPIIGRLARLKSATDLASPLITQALAVRFLGSLATSRELRRHELKPRRDLLAALLAEHLPGWTFRVPAGGLFLWTKLPFGDAREFAQTSLRHGVVVLPGPVMSASDRYSAYLRLPFLAEPETLHKGARRLATAWQDYQSTVGKPAHQQSLTLV